MAGARLQLREVCWGLDTLLPPAGGGGRVGHADGGQRLQGLERQRGRVARGWGQLPSAARSPDWRHHRWDGRTQSGLTYNNYNIGLNEML